MKGKKKSVPLSHIPKIEGAEHLLGERYLRVRILREHLMRPSLAVGDIAVIDLVETKGQQGQIVAVETRAHTTIGGLPEDAKVSKPFWTFRRHFDFAGAHLFILEEEGKITQHLEHSRFYNVAAVEVDEMSGSSRKARPMELASRLMAARHAQQILTQHRMFGPQFQNAAQRKTAIEQAARLVTKLTAEFAVRESIWNSPSPGKVLRDFRATRKSR